jgi:hypothetical protein
MNTKLNFCFLLLLSIVQLTLAQSPTGSSAINPVGGDSGALVVHKLTNTQYDNSQYLPSEDWRNGYFVQANGKRFEMAQMRYDTHLQRVEYKEGNDRFYPKEKIIEFGFANGDVFQSRFRTFNGLDEDTFFQVLYNGKTKLLKHIETTVSDITPYNSASKINHFNYYITYYVLKENGQFTKSKKINDGLLVIFNDKSENLNFFVKNNRLKIKDIDPLKQVLAHYDSL